MKAKDKCSLLKEEQDDIDNIIMETLERILSETCEACACIRKTYEEKDYEVWSMRVCATELEEELERERTSKEDQDTKDEGFDSKG